MLEHLGLGIELSMEDNFTPQANNALASMERLQAGAESMASHVGQSMSNLQNLMLAGFSLNEVGDSLQQAGQNILSVFSKFGQQFTQINASYQTMQAQLVTAFKGNSEEASKAFDWIRDFSAHTPFEVKGLGESFQKLKATGIDMRDSFKLANGEAKTLAEAIGDLATRNMSATGGVEGLGYALQEAWAGQSRSLITRFNLAKSDLDGLMQYAGKNAQKFSEEFIKLSQKFTPDAMKNMGGTWAQTMSNMDDMWNNFIYDLGKTGIWREVNESLSYIQKKLNDVFSDPEAVKAFGQTLSALWSPIKYIIKGLTDITTGILRFSEAHPTITKFVAGFTAISGVLLVVTGAVMKLFGSMLILGTSIVSVYANFQILKSLGVASAFSGLTAEISGLVSILGTLGLVAGAFALAWHTNFMDIRDKGLGTFNQLKDAWAGADKLMQGNTKDAKISGKVVTEMKMSGDMQGAKQAEFYNGWVEKFAKVKALGMAMWKTVFGNKNKDGHITFTESEMNALKATGMLGVAQHLVMARERVEAFFKGFKEGLSSTALMIWNYVSTVFFPFKGIILGIVEAFKPLKDFFTSPIGEGGIPKSLGEQQLETAKKIGQAVGIVVASFLGFKAVRGLTSIINKPFKAIRDSITKTSDKLDSLKNKLSTGFAKIPNPFSGINSSPSPTSPSFLQKFFGKGSDGAYNYDKAYEVYKSYDKTAILPHKGQKEGDYRRVYGNQMYESFLDYNIKQNKNADSNNLYVKDRSLLARKLFGDQYFSKNKDGSMNKVGNFGGLLNVDRDDNQIRLSAQDFVARGNEIDRGQPRGFIRRAKDLLDYRSRIPDMDSQVGTLKTLGLSNLKPNSQLIAERIKDMYKHSGVDGRKFNNPYNRYDTVTDKDGKTSQVENWKWAQREEQKRAFKQNFMAKDPVIQAEMNKGKNNNQTVYKAKRSAVGSALLGDRYYKLDRDERGNLYENTIARKGGLLRNHSNDMQYNEEGNTSFGARANRVISRVSGAIKTGAPNLAQRIGAGINSTNQAIVNMPSTISTKASNLASKAKDIYSKPTVQYLTRPIRFVVRTVSAGVKMYNEAFKEVTGALKSVVTDHVLPFLNQTVVQPVKRAYRFIVTATKEWIGDKVKKAIAFKNRVFNTINQVVIQPVKRAYRFIVTSTKEWIGDKIKKAVAFKNRVFSAINQTVIQPIVRTYRFIVTSTKQWIGDKVQKAMAFKTKVFNAINQTVVQPIRRYVTAKVIGTYMNLSLLAQSAKQIPAKVVQGLKGLIRPLTARVNQNLMVKYALKVIKDKALSIPAIIRKEAQLFKNTIVKPINQKIVQPVVRVLSHPIKTISQKVSPLVTRMTGFASRRLKPITQRISAPIRRIVSPIITNVKGAGGLGASMMGLGSSLFGRGTKNAQTGKVTGGGLITRTARMGVGAVSMAGRMGAGALRMGMGLLNPFGMTAMIGRSVFQGIKAKGDGDFNKGLANIRNQIKGMDFSAMWNKFKAQGKQTVSILKDIGKIIWAKWKQDGGKIMGDCFKGIVGLAKIAWTAIKANALPAFKAIGNILGDLIGKAFGSKAGNAVKSLTNYLTGNTKVLKTIVGVVAGVVVGFKLFSSVFKVVSSAFKVGMSIFKTVSTIFKVVATGAKFLGTVFTILTSPIGLVVLAIIAVIAIGVLLYKNWDTIKAKAGELMGVVKEKFNSIKEGIGQAVEGAKIKFGELLTSASEKFNSVKKTAVEIVDGIKDKFKAGLDAVLGFFANFKPSFPHIPLPHFSISGSANPLSWITDGVPKISVNWYAKGGIFDSPSVIGVGEAGTEAVLPLQGGKMIPFANEVATRINEHNQKANTPKNTEASKPQHIDNSVHIDKVEIIVKADSLSRSDARSQAKMILEELKKMGKEQAIRQYVY